MQLGIQTHNACRAAAHVVGTGLTCAQRPGLDLDEQIGSAWKLTRLQAAGHRNTMQITRHQQCPVHVVELDGLTRLHAVFDQRLNAATHNVTQLRLGLLHLHNHLAQLALDDGDGHMAFRDVLVRQHSLCQPALIAVKRGDLRHGLLQLGQTDVLAQPGRKHGLDLCRVDQRVARNTDRLEQESGLTWFGLCSGCRLCCLRLQLGQ